MNSPDPVLSLLGLALRGGRLAVGEEPVDAVCRSKHCRLLLLAGDAADNTVRRVRHFSEVGACILLQIPHTKADLGRAVGRASAAVVAVTDIGLAAAVARRLAQMDPARYGKAVEQLDTKARRAQQRREEQRAHEKNVRTGRYKGAPPPPPAEEDPPKQNKTEGKKAAAKKAAVPGEKPASRKDRTPSHGKDGNGSKYSNGKSSASSHGRSRKGHKADPYAHSRPVKKGKGSFRGTGR